MSRLRNLAQANGKLYKLKPWHESLATIISPNAVFYLFMGAEVKNGVMFFDDNDLLERALNFKNEVNSVLPYTVMASRTVVLPWETRQKLGADGCQGKHRG